MGDENQNDQTADDAKPVTIAQLRELLEAQKKELTGSFEGFKTFVNNDLATHRKRIEKLVPASGETPPKAEAPAAAAAGISAADIRAARQAEALRASLPEAVRTALDAQLAERGEVSLAEELAFWNTAKAVSEKLAPTTQGTGGGPTINTTLRGGSPGPRSNATLPSTKKEWNALPLEKQLKLLNDDIRAGGNFDPALLPRGD